MRISTSEICSAADPEGTVVGSKVTNVFHFLQILNEAVSKHDFTADSIPGQALIVLPEDVLPHVSSGVGRRSPNPNDYVCRVHRGIVSAYLRRQFAEPAQNCSVVVYTTGAYFRDPDVKVAERARMHPDTTHVLVAVLAHAGPTTSPLPPYRLVWNLAGGNLAAALWSAEEIHERAKLAIEYDSAWSTVAD